MSWNTISLDQRDRLLGLYEQGCMPELTEIANQYGMSIVNLERRLREHRLYKKEYAGQFLRDVTIPASPSRRYTDFEKLNANSAIIISDTEIPDHNPIYLLLALMIAIKRNIKTLIIAGDLIATDQQALNAWIPVISENGESSYAESVNMVRSILAEFEQWFDEIYIIEGNHDDRVARKTSGEVHLGMFIDHYETVAYSRYSYLQLETCRGLVWVVHPQNFSGDPIVLGQKLYGVHSPKGHWVLGHCHRRQDGHTQDGDFEIHALGTGRDAERTKYKQTRMNTHKQWDQSFLVIDEGFHYPLDLKSTNWQRELGDLYPVFLEKARVYGDNK